MLYHRIIIIMKKPKIVGKYCGSHIRRTKLGRENDARAMVLLSMAIEHADADVGRDGEAGEGENQHL